MTITFGTSYWVIDVRGAGLQERRQNRERVRTELTVARYRRITRKRYATEASARAALRAFKMSAATRALLDAVMTTPLYL